MPALLQAFARLVALKRLGVLLFVLAGTLGASGTASALEPTQIKTRVWGFHFAEHNSDGLLSVATHGKHRGNRSALSEVASGSLLVAEGVETGAQALSRDAHMWEGMGQLSHGGGISADTALESGAEWVGQGYREVAPGVFRSSDGLRQFRMMTEDLVGAHGNIGPHVHFESLNPLGRVIENNHVPLLPDVLVAP